MVKDRLYNNKLNDYTKEDFECKNYTSYDTEPYHPPSPKIALKKISRDPTAAA